MALHESTRARPETLLWHSTVHRAASPPRSPTRRRRDRESRRALDLDHPVRPRGERTLTTAAWITSLTAGALAALGGLSTDWPITLGLVLLAVLLAATSVLVWVATDQARRSADRLRSSEAEVRLAYERTLEAWAKALEHRDRETEGHSRRVSALAVRLARELGIREPELTRIRWGALLHDIGKLAIPDHVLLKPGPLDDAERRLMNLHPVYAREMLAGIPFLRPVVDIPYHHHERWDGSGYPEGLAGEEIPLAARIFAVVDQWEALSSDRPYRSAWRREEILDYMEGGAGSLFDPHIVRVFLERVAPDV